MSQPGSTLITEGDAEPGRLCERPSMGCMSMTSSPRPALQNGPFGTALMATPISQDRRHNGGDARAHDLLGRSHSARRCDGPQIPIVDYLPCMELHVRQG